MIRRNDSQPVNLFGWLPGCLAGGLDKRSLLGSCGQHLALLLTGPATDMGACDHGRLLSDRERPGMSA
jgi:hypothetical protein